MRLTSIILILLITLFMAPNIAAVELIDFDSESNSTYLPFSLENKYRYDTPMEYMAVWAPLKVYRPMYFGDSLAKFTSAANSAPNIDQPAGFHVREFPLDKIEDTPFWIMIKDYDLYDDRLSGNKTAAIFGFYNDTAWAIKYNIEDYSSDRIYLTHGEDRTGNGIWQPEIKILEKLDYDNDQLTELFVFVTSGRDMYPRVLFCLEAETFQVEWSLDMAGVMENGNFHILNDTTNPGILFCSYNPKQGVKDANFSDHWSYLVLLDTSGNIVNKKITSFNYDGSYLEPSGRPDKFYFTYECFEDEVHPKDSPLYGKYYLSIIDLDFNRLKTVQLPNLPRDMWRGWYPPLRDTLLFVNITYNSLYAYDSDLNLVARTDKPTPIYDFEGAMKITGYDDDIYLFRDGLYTQTFEKLAQMPATFINFDVFGYDSLSRARLIVVNAPNHGEILEIKKRNFWALATIFIRNNQNYLLGALAFLFGAFMVANYSRYRTARDRNLIARQKKEIEKTYAELEKAHADLKDAQEKIIEQEKYKQFKDIAGGFAHEIRNALFPADGLLHKLALLRKAADADPEKIKEYQNDIRRAIKRAVGMTELIMQYTKLNSLILPEAVNIKDAINKVIESNKMTIEAENVEVDIRSGPDIQVRSNSEQLNIVFNNLMLNSLDALTNTENGLIYIDVAWQSDFAEVTFSDNGTGIPEENLNKIFDGFYSTKPNKGTGIGLTMTKKIVEMYGGSITVSSKLGEGTTFKIRMKLHT